MKKYFVRFFNDEFLYSAEELNKFFCYLSGLNYSVLYNCQSNDIMVIFSDDGNAVGFIKEKSDEN